MKVYLAAPHNAVHCKEEILKSPYVLESYAYFQPWETSLINKDFLLDSGAFTFLSKTTAGVDWDAYVRQYAEFINKHSIRLFFELDIDSIVGIKEVERLRNLLERLTGRQCIPVWHKSRGKQYFVNIVKNYEYVAIGGLVTKEIVPNEYRYLPWFIDKAHEHGSKIHGLGFTRLSDYHKYCFDSVDSSSRTSGRRFGTVYTFKDGELAAYSRKDARLHNYKRADVHNLRQWIAFQKYAHKRL